MLLPHVVGIDGSELDEVVVACCYALSSLGRGLLRGGGKLVALHRVAVIVKLVPVAIASPSGEGVARPRGFVDGCLAVSPLRAYLGKGFEEPVTLVRLSLVEEVLSRLSAIEGAVAKALSDLLKAGDPLIISSAFTSLARYVASLATSVGKALSREGATSRFSALGLVEARELADAIELLGYAREEPSDLRDRYEVIEASEGIEGRVVALRDLLEEASSALASLSLVEERLSRLLASLKTLATRALQAVDYACSKREKPLRRVCASARKAIESSLEVATESLVNALEIARGVASTVVKMLEGVRERFLLPIHANRVTSLAIPFFIAVLKRGRNIERYVVPPLRASRSGIEPLLEGLARELASLASKLVLRRRSDALAEVVERFGLEDLRRRCLEVARAIGIDARMDLLRPS